MGKKASALIKIVDCVKRRLLHEHACEEKATCLKRELDRRRDGPVTDPCWTWVSGYVSEHEHEMTDYGIDWLEDQAERSKYGGRSYDEVLQSIDQFELDCKNEKDDCNQPAKAQETPRGLRVAVATRLASSGVARGHETPQNHVQARLGVSFSKPQPTPPPPPCGPGTPDLFAKRQDACPAVPQLVFISASPDIGHRFMSKGCSGVEITSPNQDALIVKFKAEYTAQLFLMPKWLPSPPGVNVSPSSYTFKTSVTPMARVRLECSDGQALLAEAANQPVDNGGVKFSHDFSFSVAIPQAGGEYTLRSVMMARWNGDFSVDYGGQNVISGSFERAAVADPMTSEGDGSCDIGVFRIVDLRDLSETIRATSNVSGTGSDDDPYSAEPNFVAKSPYGFSFKAYNDPLLVTFASEEVNLQSTYVTQWTIIRDCVKYRVVKRKVLVSPPRSAPPPDQPQTIYLPHTFIRDYAYATKLYDIVKLSKITINGEPLSEVMSFNDTYALTVKNNNPMTVDVTALGRSYSVDPGESIYIAPPLCDVYAGTVVDVVFQSTDLGFCELDGMKTASFQAYIINEKWKRDFSQQIRVIYGLVSSHIVEEYGGCDKAVRVLWSLTALSRASSSDSCFSFTYEVDVVARLFNGEFEVRFSSANQTISEYHDIPCQIECDCYDIYVERYNNVEIESSGQVRVTKTLIGYGKRVVATYEMAGDEYANLVSIEEIP